jgi:lipid-binding SYLF domain-containing protein
MNKELAGKAKGILIFPSVTKAGAGVAGEFGEGVLQVKGKVVDYYSVTSGSVGVTLGVGTHSEMIMFMTQESLDDFIKSDGWSAGGDAAVAVVTAGTGGTYDSETIGKPILGFVFSQKGLIGDLSFEGAKSPRSGLIISGSTHCRVNLRRWRPRSWQSSEPAASFHYLV